MYNETQFVGNTNELKCMLAFIELGYLCSIPYGNSAKYDFIVDVNGKLLKIQCKASRSPKYNGVIDEGSFIIYMWHQTTNTKETKRFLYSSKDVDYFATSFNNTVYLIPFSDGEGSKTLRLTTPKNNLKSYNKASDYEIHKVINDILNLQ